MLHAMQIRSYCTLGLGGRPNRLNQLLTLFFIVGVQVSYELQRWKYESANYLNFVNQYFGSVDDTRKLSQLSTNLANQFNPLNPFNDQITPVSIQISEQYQSLLQDYCMQQADDFMQSQAYLCFVVCLLVVFCVVTRARNTRHMGAAGHAKSAQSSSSKHHATSGKLVASQHESNTLTELTPSHFQSFAAAHNNVAAGLALSANGRCAASGNVFAVTLITVPIYFVSIVMHIYGQNTANRDLISSVTLVLIAFCALIGIFLPILLQIHRYNSYIRSGAAAAAAAAAAASSSGVDRLPGSITRQVLQHHQSKLHQHQLLSSSSSSAHTTHSSTAAMFPEFVTSGHRRPSSASGDSSNGGGSRRPFADTKESRRNMSTALAALDPSADSLRSMGIVEHSKPIDHALLNLKLNLSANDELMPSDDMMAFAECAADNAQQQQRQSNTVLKQRAAKGEKRLIMLDVDPCCPRHGVVATNQWPRTSVEIPRATSTSKSNNCTNNNKPRSSNGSVIVASTSQYNNHKHNHHQ